MMKFEWRAGTHDGRRGENLCGEPEATVPLY